MSDLIHNIKAELKRLFYIDDNLSPYEATLDSITASSRFQGINVWFLIFAIFVASVGLNVNSTAVIIGAMLISPLMGPIVAIGLSLGTLNLPLLKKAGRNLAVMIVVSLIVSTVYFLLSPIKTPSTEILARTSPTIWDVLIALFGGLAGIFAVASRERGQVIPGVAIATALMPPICSAGFGLAQGDMSMFFGALYLFMINGVMISFSAFLVTRFLRFPLATYAEAKKQRKYRRIMSFVVFITVAPSIFFGYRLIRATIEKQTIDSFLRTEVEPLGVRVIATNFSTSSDPIKYPNGQIDVAMLGPTIDSASQVKLKRKFADKGMDGYDLHFIQSTYAMDPAMLANRTEVRAFVQLNNQIDSLSKENDSVKRSLAQYQTFNSINGQLSTEIATFIPSCQGIYLMRPALDSVSRKIVPRKVICIFNKNMPNKDLDATRKWIRNRLSDSALLVQFAYSN